MKIIDKHACTTSSKHQKVFEFDVNSLSNQCLNALRKYVGSQVLQNQRRQKREVSDKLRSERNCEVVMVPQQKRVLNPLYDQILTLSQIEQLAAF